MKLMYLLITSKLYTPLYKELVMSEEYQNLEGSYNEETKGSFNWKRYGRNQLH